MLMSMFMSIRFFSGNDGGSFCRICTRSSRITPNLASSSPETKKWLCPTTCHVLAVPPLSRLALLRPRTWTQRPPIAEACIIASLARLSPSARSAFCFNSPRILYSTMFRTVWPSLAIMQLSVEGTSTQSGIQGRREVVATRPHSKSGPTE